MDKDKIVILPLGSCEQHGPHMPLLTDTLIVTALAEAVEQEMADDVLLLPSLWTGMSDHHLQLAGTVTLNPELYTRTLVRTLATIADHGFRKIFLLNGHGGNQVPATQALVELYSQGYERRDLWIGMSSYWLVGKPTIDRLAADGIGGIRMESPMLTHACEWEYSLGLHLFPDLCRPDQVKAIPTEFKTAYYDVDLSIHRISLSTPFTAFIPTGAANRPELATTQKGEALYNGLFSDLVEFFDAMKSWKTHPSNEDMGVY
jgi:creatinine amidohydrolase